MLRLDFLGLLISLFLLGPKHWRWSLAAAGVALTATVLTLIVWRADLTAYTMGGIFTQVDLAGGRWPGLILGLAGPFACYTVARFAAKRPMGQTGWLRQILPWSELENPMAGTFAKFAVLAGVFSILKELT